MTPTILGVDTTFLVEVEISEGPNHARARQMLDEDVLSGSHRLAIAPQVLLEFVHVVTDEKRFLRPFPRELAVSKARFWWMAREVVHVYPTSESVDLFFMWMVKHRLGRKRILDTFLAATYRTFGVEEIVTTNTRDFSPFEGVRARRP